MCGIIPSLSPLPHRCGHIWITHDKNIAGGFPFIAGIASGDGSVL